MKIVYSILGTFNSGGMERVLANKANYLTQCGHEVIVITTDQKGRKPYFYFDSSIQFYDLGINYTDANKKKLFHKIVLYFFKRYKHYNALKRELNHIKADIVISMFDNDSSFLHKINDGSEKIIEAHFSRFKRIQYNRKGVFKWIDNYLSNKDQRIVAKYDRFIVLTEEDKGYWNDLINIEVIPNANSFVSMQKAKLENKKVVAVGRFDYQKGFDDLIKSWKIVHDSHPDWILNIFGHGPLDSEFKNLITVLGLDNVVFLNQPTKEIEQVYLDHSILAMTSRYEGLPMVLLEAQECGLPLVSYDCKCGPKDIIKDNGILVPQGDIENMAQSLIKLISNEKLRKSMGTKSSSYALNYSESLIMDKWIKLFEGLVK